MRRPILLAVLVGLAGEACGEGSSPNKVPVDVQSDFPSVDKLKISIPGQRGATGSASETVFVAVDQAAAALRSLSILQDYLAQGGEEKKGLSVTIALQGAPRVVDQVVRYLRLPSRLDVERSGNHAFFYLQYNPGDGFDPDSAIGESRMLIEGSTLVPGKPGTRADPATAHGLVNSSLGYMRFHFNHRAEDVDQVRAAAQLDYNMGTGSLNFTYFTLPTAKGDLPVAFWQKREDSGGGLVYASQKGSNGLAYQFLAQYGADGSLAVWHGDGKLWGCYDPTGAEIGSEKSPSGCASFKDKFVAPPENPDLWPALPSGIP